MWKICPTQENVILTAPSTPQANVGGSFFLSDTRIRRIFLNPLNPFTHKSPLPREREHNTYFSFRALRLRLVRHSMLIMCAMLMLYYGIDFFHAWHGITTITAWLWWRGVLVDDNDDDPDEHRRRCWPPSREPSKETMMLPSHARRHDWDVLRPLSSQGPWMWGIELRKAEKKCCLTLGGWDPLSTYGEAYRGRRLKKLVGVPKYSESHLTLLQELYWMLVIEQSFSNGDDFSYSAIDYSCHEKLV